MPIITYNSNAAAPLIPPSSNSANMTINGEYLIQGSLQILPGNIFPYTAYTPGSLTSPLVYCNDLNIASVCYASNISASNFNTILFSTAIGVNLSATSSTISACSASFISASTLVGPYTFSSHITSTTNTSIFSSVEKISASTLGISGPFGCFGISPTSQFVGINSDVITTNASAVFYDDTGFSGDLGSTTYTPGDVVRALKLIGLFQL